MKPTTYTAVVSSVVNVAGEFYVARFALVDPKEMEFQAGQYAIFLIGPPKGKHTLSIASPPSMKDEIEILQSVAPMGGGSKWLLGLKPGDTVKFLGPLGKFTLQKESPLRQRSSEASPRPKVFVATGCGLAPLRAMILDYLEMGGTAPITLWWGLRHETDIFWQEELDNLRKKYPNFQYVTTLSKPASPTNRGEPTDAWMESASRRRGRVTEHVVGETTELTHSEFYLCGNRQMIIDMKGLLADNGVPSEQIYTETFF